MSCDCSTDYEVVWSGRDELIPDRPSARDLRYETVPSFDLDDEDRPPVERAKRHFVLSGKYVGCKKNGKWVPHPKHYACGCVLSGGRKVVRCIRHGGLTQEAIALVDNLE